MSYEFPHTAAHCYSNGALIWQYFQSTIWGCSEYLQSDEHDGYVGSAQPWLLWWRKTCHPMHHCFWTRIEVWVTWKWATSGYTEKNFTTRKTQNNASHILWHRGSTSRTVNTPHSSDFMTPKWLQKNVFQLEGLNSFCWSTDSHGCKRSCCYS